MYGLHIKTIYKICYTVNMIQLKENKRMLSNKPVVAINFRGFKLICKNVFMYKVKNMLVL